MAEFYLVGEGRDRAGPLGTFLAEGMMCAKVQVCDNAGVGCGKW